MSELGYSRYGVHGGDWGASVATMLAQVDAPRCAAIHLTQPMVSPNEEERADATPAERDALERRAMSRRTESAGLRLQATRPQTIGYGLVDSPALLAAWIVEKFRSWSDCDGDVESVFSRDELLDNVTLYWLTGTGASSARLYWEANSRRSVDLVSTPTGVTMFGGEGLQSSRRWVARRHRDLRFWNQPPRGGHFPALEQPDVLLHDLAAFFGDIASGPAPST
jgi:pimeloyl-ACP methyl ester carboxylesterase